MDLELKGRWALITGGSKGIGRACAELLAERYGARIDILVNNAVAFLASDLSGSTTGTILTIDGGQANRR